MSYFLILLLLATKAVADRSQGAVRVHGAGWLVFSLPEGLEQAQEFSSQIIQSKGAKPVANVRVIANHPGENAFASLQLLSEVLVSRNSHKCHHAISEARSRLESWIKLSQEYGWTQTKDKPSFRPFSGKTREELSHLGKELEQISHKISQEQADTLSFYQRSKEMANELEDLLGPPHERYLVRLAVGSGRGTMSFGEIDSKEVAFRDGSYLLVSNTHEGRFEQIAFLELQDVGLAFVFEKSPDDPVVLEHLANQMIASAKIVKSKPDIYQKEAVESSTILKSVMSFWEKQEGQLLIRYFFVAGGILLALTFVLLPAYLWAGRAYDACVGQPTISMKMRTKMILGITFPIAIPSAALALIIVLAEADSFGGLSETDM
jgi:hypothetical protein